MRKAQAKIVVAYYCGIEKMKRGLMLDRENLEDEYNGLRGIAIDGMPHACGMGNQTAVFAEQAAAKNVWERMQEIDVKLCVLDADAAEIRACLDGLCGEYRRLILLRHSCKYSWARIAAGIGAPDSTVRSRYDRALERFGEALDEVVTVGELVRRASRARL